MTERTRRWFLPWKYREEEQSVNEASMAGRHLIAAGLFSRTEQIDDSVSYTYSLSAKDKSGLTEALYEKQGWEPAAKQGSWRWYRKKHSAEIPESAYTFYGPANCDAVRDQLHRIIKPLDIIRNTLLIVAFLLLLIPSEVTLGWTPRIAALPLLLTIPVVKYAENIRRVLGEDKRK